mgnify:FL=1
MFKCSGKVGEWGGSKSPPNPWDFGRVFMLVKDIGTKDGTIQPDRPTYYIKIDDDTKSVYVQCIGMECVDSTTKSQYASLDDAPEWMQRKVAILMVGGYTFGQEPIEGVGNRYGDNTFLIVPD